MTMIISRPSALLSFLVAVTNYLLETTRGKNCFFGAWFQRLQPLVSDSADSEVMKRQNIIDG